MNANQATETTNHIAIIELWAKNRRASSEMNANQATRQAMGCNTFLVGLKTPRPRGCVRNCAKKWLMWVLQLAAEQLFKEITPN
jgi:hypothetical protein